MAVTIFMVAFSRWIKSVLTPKAAPVEQNNSPQTGDQKTSSPAADHRVTAGVFAAFVPTPCFSPRPRPGRLLALAPSTSIDRTSGVNA
ncbi:hypothetical protein [uncultured Aquincola sp.]|uniref:hypothetical protein n=1 Tax=uncultured Aquincola sp. TaxID=886556 RepID=UPI0032B16C5E